MSSALLDSIIAGHGRPVILSENHDLSSIDYIAGSNDPAEMVKLSGGKEGAIAAALRRANLDVVNGKVQFFCAGENSWHKLGVNVKDALTWAQASEISGLKNLIIAKVPANYSWNGLPRESTDTWLLIRLDTGAEMGRAGKVYQPIQVDDMFACLDHVAGEFGAKYTSAGAVNGGKQFFATMEIPGLAFSVAGQDKVFPRVIFQGDNTGAGACPVFPTTWRADCENTARQAIREDGAKGIRIRHSGDIKAKILDARRALRISVDGFQEFRSAAEKMARTPIAIKPYVSEVLDQVLDITAAQAALGADVLAATLGATQANMDLEAKKLGKAIARRQEITEDILNRFESAENGQGNMRDTAYGAWNAVTNHVNHNRIGRQVGSPEDRQSRRMESVLMGAGDSMIQAAYSLATR